MTGGLVLFIFIIGGAVFLLMVHPLIFWLIALPIAIILVINFVRWVKK